MNVRTLRQDIITILGFRDVYDFLNVSETINSQKCG